MQYYPYDGATMYAQYHTRWSAFGLFNNPCNQFPTSSMHAVPMESMDSNNVPAVLNILLLEEKIIVEEYNYEPLEIIV